MSDSEQNHLTQERKRRLEQALKAVKEVNGSSDIIASLMKALEEYDLKKWHKFLKPVLSNMQARIPPCGSWKTRGGAGKSSRSQWCQWISWGGRGAYYCSSTVICSPPKLYEVLTLTVFHFVDWLLADLGRSVLCWKPVSSFEGWWSRLSL